MRVHRQVEQFEIKKRIGSGYASSVYYAVCKLSGTPVALKAYHKVRLTELNLFQIQREITIHSSVDHRNIIQLVRVQYRLRCICMHDGGRQPSQSCAVPRCARSMLHLRTNMLSTSSRSMPHGCDTCYGSAIEAVQACQRGLHCAFGHAT